MSSILSFQIVDEFLQTASCLFRVFCNVGVAHGLFCWFFFILFRKMFFINTNTSMSWRIIDCFVFLTKAVAFYISIIYSKDLSSTVSFLHILSWWNMKHDIVFVATNRYHLQQQQQQRQPAAAAFLLYYLNTLQQHSYYTTLIHYF